MTALRRHRLVRLSAAGWAATRSQPWDAEARECLDFWAAQQLPLVVTQQPSTLPEDHIALGLPAPLRWNRRRIALQVPANGLLCFDEFPLASRIDKLLPPSVRAAWRSLSDELEAVGVEVCVYGSHGWQALTGLDYLHAASDLDLRMLVPDSAAADSAVAALSAARFDKPRLDGELMFADGSAVAWREWQNWRCARVDRFLVKRLHGAALEQTCPG
ncbi:MAG: malonate decarboxylase holo-[acyl-carrier-protein] synthase [Burkholderiales bacterium]